MGRYGNVCLVEDGGGPQLECQCPVLLTLTRYRRRGLRPGLVRGATATGATSTGFVCGGGSGRGWRRDGEDKRLWGGIEVCGGGSPRTVHGGDALCDAPGGAAALNLFHTLTTHTPSGYSAYGTTPHALERLPGRKRHHHHNTKTHTHQQRGTAA